jgi:hypothetical protein
MKIAYVLYPDFTALDLVGPYPPPGFGEDERRHVTS